MSAEEQKITLIPRRDILIDGAETAATTAPAPAKPKPPKRTEPKTP